MCVCAQGGAEGQGKWHLLRAYSQQIGIHAHGLTHWVPIHDHTVPRHIKQIRDSKYEHISCQGGIWTWMEKRTCKHTHTHTHPFTLRTTLIDSEININTITPINKKQHTQIVRSTHTKTHIYTPKHTRVLRNTHTYTQKHRDKQTNKQNKPKEARARKKHQRHVHTEKQHKNAQNHGKANLRMKQASTR